MKRKYIIMVTILVIIAIILYLTRIEPLLTGKPEEVIQISISSQEDMHATKRIYNDATDIAEIMETIQKIEKRYTERHPNHAESLQTDSSFTLELRYKGGTKDKLNLSSEVKTSLTRFLDTRGGSGDRGFTGGRNEYLYDYLTELFSDTERSKEVVSEEDWLYN